MVVRSGGSGGGGGRGGGHYHLPWKCACCITGSSIFVSKRFVSLYS